MALTDLIKQTVVDDIENFLGFGGFSLYSRQNPQLRSLYEQNMIDDETLVRGIDKYLLKKAKEQYDRIVAFKKKNPGMSIAGMSFPEYVIYGIEKEIFTQKELDTFPENLDDMIKTYKVKNLVEIMKNDLLHPKTLPEFKGSHCCCSCC